MRLKALVPVMRLKALVPVMRLKAMVLTHSPTKTVASLASGLRLYKVIRLVSVMWPKALAPTMILTMQH